MKNVKKSDIILLLILLVVIGYITLQEINLIFFSRTLGASTDAGFFATFVAQLFAYSKIKQEEIKSKKEGDPNGLEEKTSE